MRQLNGLLEVAAAGTVQRWLAGGLQWLGLPGVVAVFALLLVALVAGRGWSRGTAGRPRNGGGAVADILDQRRPERPGPAREDERT